MPDLRNKYSDTELNPANKDFEELVNRPDMKALDDRGDAIARDLKKRENDPEVPDDFNEGDGKDAARRAEAKQWNAPENRFGYRPSGKENDVASGSTRRKNALRFGIPGLLLLIALLGSGFLLPLKIPGIMQMIADEAGQRVEQVTEKRAKLIIGRYILNHAFTGSGVVLTGEGAFSTLMASMKTARFETKLEKKGLKITRVDGGVKLARVDGKELGGGKVLKNEAAVLNALDSDNLTRKMVNELVKEEIPSWRWMKKAKFAKWLRIKYGIPRYGIENRQDSDEEQRVKDMQKDRLKTEVSSQVDTLSEAVDCFLTTECAADTGDSQRPDTATSNDSSTITDSANATVDEYVEANTENPGKGITKSLYKMVLDKIGSKAIPIVGWIDLVATIDHISWEAAENDYFGKVVAYYRATQYAKHYGIWSGYGSQVQLGAMDPAFIGELASQTEGIEESEAFQMIEGNAGVGKEVKRINANSRTGFADTMKDLRVAMTAGPLIGQLGGLPGIPNDIGDKVVHYTLNAYYETIGGGGLLGWVSGLLGDLVTKIGTTLLPDQFETWLYNMISKVGEKFLEAIGLDFDPMISGADWFGAAHGGATWTYNDFCKTEVGCRKLTPAQTAQQNSQVAADRAEYRQEKGPLYALFSTETPTSLTSQLAIHAPTNATSAAANMGRIITGAPARLMGLVTGKTSASAYTDLYGIDPYGATTADLNAPLSEKFIKGEACSDDEAVHDGSTFNSCLADTMVAEAMLCEFKPESEDCAENDSSDLTCAEGVGNGTVPSWSSLPDTSKTPVGGAVNGTIDMAAANIKLGSGINSSLNTITNSRPDFITLNEVGETSLSALEGAAPGYGAYREPNVDGGVGGGQRSLDNAIMWRKDKWTRLQGGRVKVTEDDKLFFKGNATTWDRWAAWGIFKRTDGAIVSVISTHMMTNPEKFPRQHGNPELTRIQQYKLSMEILLQLTSVLSRHGPVFVGGDMNNQANQGDWSAVPMMKSAGYGYVNDGAVMYVFNPKGTRITENRTITIDSDHRAVLAKIAMNGTGPSESTIASSGSSGCGNETSTTDAGWSWPVDKKWWETGRTDFLSAHPGTGTAWGADNMGTSDKGSGVAADIGNPPDGSPVYAMLSGVVTSTNLCGANDGIAIKSKIGSDTVGIAYMHGTNKQFKVGDTVKAGDKIMDLGVIGCSVSGGHVHIGIAYNGKYVCPQDVFLAMGAGQSPDLAALVGKAKAPCGRI